MTGNRATVSKEPLCREPVNKVTVSRVPVNKATVSRATVRRTSRFDADLYLEIHP